MSTLVEAMAMAMAKAEHPDAEAAAWSAGSDDYRDLALASLKAMKEHGPTQKMAWAYELPHVGPDECAAMFDAMLQAAIDEVEL